MSAMSREAREPLIKWIDNGGVLVRFAGPHLAAKRRRSGAGAAAPRRPHPRRQPELGQAAEARRLLARQPVQRHGGAERRHRHPPGAGGAGRAAHRPHLGDARRRHAAGHRPAPRQGPAGAVPRHRRHALVRPAAVRHLRRHAPAHRGARRHDRQHRKRRHRRRRGRQRRNARWCRRPACSTASAPSRCRRRPRARCRPISTRRADADHPPGFYGPPEGLVAVNTLAPGDRPAPLDFPRSTPASTSTGMASRSTCAGRSSWPRWRCCCSTRWW